MKRTLNVMIFVLLSLSLALGQVEKKYEKVYFKKTSIETDDASIKLVNIVSTDKFLKFKMKIKNKTGDYLLVKASGTKLIIKGSEILSKSKESVVIAPTEEETMVISFSGEGLNKESAFHCTIENQGIYKISKNGNVVETPDFKLPVSKPDFSTGGFVVKNTSLYKQSDATKTDFTISYFGNKLGCIFTGYATLLMPDRNEYQANKIRGNGLVILEKGEKHDLTLKWDRVIKSREMDMQFVEMFIKWHETFCEVSPVLLNKSDQSIDIDEARTIKGGEKGGKAEKEE